MLQSSDLPSYVGGNYSIRSADYVWKLWIFSFIYFPQSLQLYEDPPIGVETETETPPPKRKGRVYLRVEG